MISACVQLHSVQMAWGRVRIEEGDHEGDGKADLPSHHHALCVDEEHGPEAEKSQE